MKNIKSLKKIALAMLPVTLLFAHSASAEFHYDFIQASYSRIDVDFEQPAIDDETGDGLGISGSYSINDKVAIGARFESFNVDTTALFEGGGRGALDIKTTAYGVFGLYHSPLNDKADYFVGGEFNKVKVETNGPNGRLSDLSNNDDSKSLFAGVRYQFNEQVELEGVIKYDLDAATGTDEIGFLISSRYVITPTIALGVAFQPDDTGDTLTISLRKNLTN
jgi:hypothetical protein